METYVNARQGYDWTISYPSALQAYTETEWFKDWITDVVSLILRAQTVNMIEMIQVNGLRFDLASAKEDLGREQRAMEQWKLHRTP